LVDSILIYTDEDNIYERLPVWGYEHDTVCHGRGEYARDEDDDGPCEVQVNTLEGFWSLPSFLATSPPGYLRRSFRSIWPSSNSFTMRAKEERHCSVPSCNLGRLTIKPAPRNPGRAGCIMVEGVGFEPT
jgi:hypothetical protein